MCVSIRSVSNTQGGTGLRTNSICVPDLMLTAFNVQPTTDNFHSSGAGSHLDPDPTPTTSSKFQKRLKRKRGKTAAAAAKYDTIAEQVDLMFCATSLVIEFKEEALFKILCQTIAYLVQAYDTTACRLGLLLYRARFTRLFVLPHGNQNPSTSTNPNDETSTDRDRVVLVENADPSRWGTVSDLLDVKLSLERAKDYYTHSLGHRDRKTQNPTVNPEGLTTLLTFLCSAVDLLIDLPFKGVTYDMLNGDGARKFARTRGDAAGWEFALGGTGTTGQGQGEGDWNRATSLWGARNGEDFTTVLKDMFPDMIDRLERARKRPKKKSGDGDGEVVGMDDNGNGDDGDDDGDGEDAGGNDDGDDDRRGASGGGGGSGGGEGDAGGRNDGDRTTGQGGGGGGGDQTGRGTGNPGQVSHQDGDCQPLQGDQTEMRRHPNEIVNMGIPRPSDDDEYYQDEDLYTESRRTSLGTRSRSSTSTDSDDDDDNEPEPRAETIKLDPIYQALAQLGTKVMFCSPDRMSAVVNAYVAHNLANSVATTQPNAKVAERVQAQSQVRVPVSDSIPAGSELGCLEEKWMGVEGSNVVAEGETQTPTRTR